MTSHAYEGIAPFTVLVTLPGKVLNLERILFEQKYVSFDSACKEAEKQHRPGVRTTVSDASDVIMVERD